MNDFCQFLGICRKAGKLIYGTESVKKSLAENKAKLILISSNISEKTEKELNFFAKKNNIPVVRTGFNTNELSKATGTVAGVFAVIDSGFAKRIIELGGTL